jgi:beta-N-acetylhexosaminidase
MLRNDLKFKGMILSDISEIRTPDGAAMEIPQAAVLAIKAGSDMLLVTDPSAAPGAYQRLLAAVEDGEITAERVDDAVRQILTIKAAYGLKDFTLPVLPEPDWNGNAELATQTALDAVTLLRDNEELIPLVTNQNILIVGPDRNWSFYQKLSEALFKHHITPKFDFYSNPYFGQPQETQYLTSIPQEAPHYDVTLVFTWNAHLNNLVFNNPWQIQLILNIQKSTSKLIVVALKSPTDYLDLPEVSTFLATYGTNNYLMNALIKILVGDYEPTAQFPLSVTP